MASAQGEHVFNAVNALALEMVQVLRGAVSDTKNYPGDSTAANASIDTLVALADELKTARDNAEFRSAGVGDPHNAFLYSDFAARTRTAVRGLISGGPSEHTAAYTAINRMIDDFEKYTLDTVAKTARRNELGAGRRQAFDKWLEDTRLLMLNTYKGIRDAALAVNRLRQ